MAECALGIMLSGNKLGVSVVQRNVRQKTVKLAKTYTLNADINDAASVQAEFASIIHNVISQEKIRNPRVSVGLEQQNIVWASLEMPPVSQEDLRQIVQFEIDSHVPVDPENSVFDIQLLESIEGLVSKVTLFTARKEMIENILQTARQASLALDAVSPVDTALAGFIAAHAAGDTGKNTMILVANDVGIEIILSRQGRFMTNRSVSSVDPWNERTEADEEGGAQPVVIAPENLEQNMKIALLSVNESFESFDEIFCVGEVPEAVIQRLSDMMPDIPVRRLWIENMVSRDAHYVEAAAVALACELFENTASVNLLPQKLRPVRRDIGRIMIGVASGLLLASMVLVGANNYWSTDLRLMATEAKIASMEHQVGLITEINMKHSAAQNSKNFFINKNMSYPSLLDVLLEATQLLPAEDTASLKKVWLEQLDIENNEIVIRGDSNSPEAIINAMEESPYFERVRFDGTVTGTHFMIKAAISKISRESDGDDILFPSAENGEDESSLNGVGETMKIDPSKEDKASQSGNGSMNESSGKPAEKPKSDKRQSATPAGVAEPEAPRGPAFPRQGPEPDSPDADEMHEPGSSDFQEQAPNEAVTEGNFEQEDMDAVKNQLLDLLRSRQEEHGETTEARSFEEVNPEESAANFMEFLQNIGLSEDEGNTQWQE
ncbi:MAG: hypothetical protein WBM02_08605 [bacterium]